jgi:hypothetical protein
MQQHLYLVYQILGYKYYVSGHYPLSCFYVKTHPVYTLKHNILETGFSLHLQVKPTQLGPINRDIPYLQVQR